MVARHSSSTATSISYSGYLVIDTTGAMKLSRGQPALRPGERSVSLLLTVPKALFRTPSLTAKVTIPEDTTPPAITAETVSNIENALRLGTGLNFEIIVGGSK